MEAVSVEQVFTLLVRLHAALRTADALPREAPQQTLTLEAVRRRRRAPDDEVVRRGRGDGVDERLQRLLVDVLLLRHTNENFASPRTDHGLPVDLLKSDSRRRRTGSNAPSVRVRWRMKKMIRPGH